MEIVNQIKERLHRPQFEPFIIRLSDGRKFNVPHPDFMAVAPLRVVVMVGNIAHVINPLHITSIQDSFLPNPKRRRRKPL